MSCYCTSCTSRTFPRRVPLPELDSDVFRCKCGEWRSGTDPCEICAQLEQGGAIAADEYECAGLFA